MWMAGSTIIMGNRRPVRLQNSTGLRILRRPRAERRARNPEVLQVVLAQQPPIPVRAKLRRRYRGLTVGCLMAGLLLLLASFS